MHARRKQSYKHSFSFIQKKCLKVIYMLGVILLGFFDIIPNFKYFELNQPPTYKGHVSFNIDGCSFNMQQIPLAPYEWRVDSSLNQWRVLVCPFQSEICLKLHNINFHNVTHSLISRNPREQMFVVQISFLIVTYLSLISRILSLMQTTKEVNPHPHIVSCVNMWSVFLFFL